MSELTAYVAEVRRLYMQHPSDFRMTLLGAFTEVAEATQELPWRPWRAADQREPTAEEVRRAANELADAVGCAVRVMVALGLDDDEITAAIWEHTHRLRERRLNGVNLG